MLRQMISLTLKNRKDTPCITKINQVMGSIESRKKVKLQFHKIFQSQSVFSHLSTILSYGLFFINGHILLFIHITNRKFSFLEIFGNF